MVHRFTVGSYQYSFAFLASHLLESRPSPSYLTDELVESLVGTKRYRNISSSWPHQEWAFKFGIFELDVPLDTEQNLLSSTC